MPRKRISNPDIQFADPKLKQLVGHVRALTQEMQHIQELLDDGQVGQVLQKRSNHDYDGEWVSGGGGGGEVNDGINVGNGIGLYLGKDGVSLQFRALSGGSGVTLTISDDGRLVITSTGTADQIEPLLFSGAA